MAQQGHWQQQIQPPTYLAYYPPVQQWTGYGPQVQQHPAYSYGTGYTQPMMGGPPQHGMPGQWMPGPSNPQPALPLHYMHMTPAQYMPRPIQYGFLPQWQAAPQYPSTVQQPPPIQYLPPPAPYHQVLPQYPAGSTYTGYYAQGPNAVQAAFSAAGLSQTGVSNTELARNLQDYVATMPREQRQRLQKKPEGNKIEKTRTIAKAQGVKVTVSTNSTSARPIKQEKCECEPSKGRNLKVHFEDLLEKVVKLKEEPN